MKKKTQKLEVADYGHHDINRLAVIVDRLEVMDKTERFRTFQYLKSRYGADWPTDTSY